MTEHDVRLLPAAGGAIVTCAWAAREGAWVAAASWWCGTFLVALAAVVGLSVASRRCPGSTRQMALKRARAIALLAALTSVIVTIVTSTAALHEHRSVPQMLHTAIQDRAQVELIGIVVSDPRPAGRDVWTGEPRTSFTMDVASVCTQPCARPQAVSLSVDAIGEGPVAVRLGALVSATGRLSASPRSRIHATLWETTLEVLREPAGMRGAVGTVRDTARHAAAGLPETVRALVLGMTIGDTSHMPSDLHADMRTTSLTHLTAVSGSHFAMVVAVLGWALTRWVPSRGTRAAVLAAAMGGLAAVVLPEPSVLRALSMALAIALGWWWGRPARAVPALGAGVIVLLLIEPGLGGAVGLHLSVIAVLAIVVWSPHLARRLGRWMSAAMARAISIPLAAWLSCWPVLVTLQPGIGLYAVPANLVGAIAAFPVTLMGLLATVVALVWPGGGALGMHLAGVCAWPIVWAARAFSAAPGHWLGWPSGWVGVTLAVVILAAVAGASAARRVRGGMQIAVLAVAVVVAWMTPMLTVREGPVLDDWNMVVCDVGQGDMMLVRVAEQAAVVIDTGPPGDAGAGCLRRYGVHDIPLLVLTHPHADHDGAVASISQVARIDQAWVSDIALSDGPGSGAYEVRARGAQVNVPTVGEVWAAGEVELVVLHSPEATHHPLSSSAINDASIALSIRAGAVTALTWGDLEVAGQDTVASRLSSVVVVDLIKVAHHGSAVQSVNLAQRVIARVAAISVGADNSYGHPALETVSLYARSASVVMTTAACGDIAVGADAAVASACPTGVAG